MSYEELQPIKGFSQRSLVSNSIFQLWVLFVPDCMACLTGFQIRTDLVWICSSGIPVMGATLTCRWKKNIYWKKLEKSNRGFTFSSTVIKSSLCSGAIMSFTSFSGASFSLAMVTGSSFNKAELVKMALLLKKLSWIESLRSN